MAFNLPRSYLNSGQLGLKNGLGGSKYTKYIEYMHIYGDRERWCHPQMTFMRWLPIHVESIARFITRKKDFCRC
jgi:hypothetical protein